MRHPASAELRRTRCRPCVALPAALAAATAVALLVAAPSGAAAQAPVLLPPSAQHPWSHRAAASGRGAMVAAQGPEKPVIRPPAWPYAPMQGAVSATPVVDDAGRVYVGSSRGVFYSLRPSAHRTSDLHRWDVPLSGPVRSAAALKPTSREYPYRRVYVTTGAGHVYALDEAGTAIWDTRLTAGPVPAASSPALSPVPGTPGAALMRVYVATSQGVVALEETGNFSKPGVRVLWREPGLGSDHSVAVGPRGDRVYVTGGGTLHVLDAAPRAAGSQVVDRVQLGGDLTGPVVDRDGNVYVGSDGGDVYRVDPSAAAVTGRRGFGGAIRTDPVLLPGGRLAVVAGGVVHAAPRDLNQTAWSFSPGAQSPSWQAASGLAADGSGAVFLAGDDGRIHAIRGGSEAWRHPVQAPGHSRPAVARDGRLYVGTDAGEVHALQSDPAFEIAYAGDQRDSTTLDVHALRSAYGSVGARRRLTDAPPPEGAPAFSPLGDWLAWVSAPANGTEDVIVGTASGRGPVNLDTGHPGNPFGVESREKDPAFSPTGLRGLSRLPDGTRYLAVTRGNAGSWTAFFVDLDALERTGRVSGVGLRAFLQRQGASRAAQAVPAQQAQVAFGPNGRWMAYGACVPGGGGARYELRVVDLRNDRPTAPASDSASDCTRSAHFHPFFSPDGDYLVYESEGELFLTDDMSRPGSALGAPPSGGPGQPPRLPGLDAPLPDLVPTLPVLGTDLAPAWSPDGTEIVFHRSGVRFDLGRVAPGVGPRLPGVEPATPDVGTTESLSLLARHGPGYSSETHLSGDRSTDGAYHPRRLPKPETRIPRCDAPNTLAPATAQPGRTLEIRGCGFDIRYPSNNTVVFPRADGSGVVRVEADGTSVDPSTGLGVLEVEVPMVAGDGQLIVDTPFGASETVADTFHVAPLATRLRRSETVPRAFVRVLGYGFETSEPGSYRVRFSGGTTVTPAAVRLEACQAPDTPCRFSRAPGGEIGWLELQVPAGVAPGPVTVERTVRGTAHTDRPGQPLTLMTPGVSLSRNSGSAGQAPGIDPVRFAMRGGGFPFDPYFGYTEVDLVQVDPGGPDRSLGRASLGPSNSFSTQRLAVRPNSGGDLTMEARLPATRSSGTLAKASAPFRTPLKDPPIVFVPGTSGTTIDYDVPPSAGGLQGRWCASTTGIALSTIALAVVGAPAGAIVASMPASVAAWPHIVADYNPGEDVWLNFHGLVHILLGCPNWLDAIHLNPQDNSPPKKFKSVQIDSVMKKIDIPVQGLDKPVYGPLFDFMKTSMNREIVEFGDSCSGQKPCTYLFNEDWRLGMESQAKRLHRLVKKAIRETGKPAVAIVTHSYGGPTTKYYLRTRSRAPQLVDQVIALGGGFMGVVKPYKILQIGSNWNLAFGPFRLKDQKPQQMARDWPTAYWQMPQSNWSLDGSAGHGSVNSICPRIGTSQGNKRARNCGWVVAEWDATKSKFGPFQYTPGPGLLGHGTEPYPFVRQATALHPFRGRVGLGPPLKKFHPNMNTSGKTKYPLGAVYRKGANFSDKFGTAYRKLLDVDGPGNPSTLSCPRFGDTGLGDWRCGTQGVFFHRVVGWGKPTQVRVRFPHDRKCITRGRVLGINVSVCYHVRKIEADENLEGDRVIPLRSAVGILESDAQFDARDSRIWGLDGTRNSDYDGDGKAENENLHFHLPQVASVQRFVQLATGGQLTDITQLPGPKPTWPSTDWPFESPCGVPARPSGVPKETSCSSHSVATASPQERAEHPYWVVQLDGDAALAVRDDRGRRAGPAPDLPGAEARTFPGIVYDRSRGRTRAWLPENSGRYEFTIEAAERAGGGEAEIEPESGPSRRPALVGLRIYPEGHLAAGPVHVFHAVPVTESSTATFTWDTDEPAGEPVLRLEAGGEVTELTPDATLTGTEVRDREPPTTEIVRDGGRMTVEATDEGGSGVHRIFWGTDRGRIDPRVYTGPVDLSEEDTYVWAFAVDRAGNTALAPAVHRTCELPMDFDGDGSVEDEDLESAVARWLDHRFDAFDLNGLGPVDVGDLQRTAAHLDRACPASVPPSPDPDRRAETPAALDVRAPGTVGLGESFTVEVAVREPADLAGFEAVLSYATGVLSLEDVSLTDRLEATGRDAGTLGPHPGTLSGGDRGAVAFGAYSTGDEPGVGEPGVLARITFTAERPGAAELEVFDAQLADTGGTLSEPVRGGARVEVVVQE